MMTMDTQFGKMIITDDNKTIAPEVLQKEIQDSIQEGKRPEFITEGIKVNK